MPFPLKRKKKRSPSAEDQASFPEQQVSTMGPTDAILDLRALRTRPRADSGSSLESPPLTAVEISPDTLDLAPYLDAPDSRFFLAASPELESPLQGQVTPESPQLGSLPRGLMRQVSMESMESSLQTEQPQESRVSMESLQSRSSHGLRRQLSTPSIGSPFPSSSSASSLHSMRLSSMESLNSGAGRLTAGAASGSLRDRYEHAEPEMELSPRSQPSMRPELPQPTSSHQARWEPSTPTSNYARQRSISDSSRLGNSMGSLQSNPLLSASSPTVGTSSAKLTTRYRADSLHSRHKGSPKSNSGMLQSLRRGFALGAEDEKEREKEERRGDNGWDFKCIGFHDNDMCPGEEVGGQGVWWIAHI
ncbi:hypothetical protein FN846DRAFT_412237 [Sphaerosporella brunnea]|uniref:Uncharacterized protein n=1 Tax=Sphaerosporella brunnea TaxID=1250544 RepID=A0A5J5EH77_9PEZI|nr:hypothetical protein FN846DRAFT_412237 [Sphaerosporella brunnea]